MSSLLATDSPTGAGSRNSEAVQSSQARSSTLSSKVTSILSTSYSDREIRTSLEILDERNVQNTAALRRQLRTDIQREVIECNGTIVDDFGHVVEQLKQIGTLISSLNDCTATMRRQIEGVKAATGPMMKEATSLMEKREKIGVQQRILTAFNNHFVISDDQQMILTSSSEAVDDQFFNELTRVQGIHRDCQVLLGGEDQTLGLDVMEKSSKCLNGAFQKLYRWVQQEFKALNLENPQISISIRRALRTLAQRPALFQSCLDSFAEAREHVLSDSFHGALTGATSEGQEIISKPIEMFAHDPLRYIGDMLAWTHSTTVSEREALEVLFVSEGDEIRKGIEAGLESDPWSRADEKPAVVFDGVKALNDLVNRDLAGVARVLRQRVEQVIHGHEDPALAYKVANLVNFYKSTFWKLLGADSPLQNTLNAIEESAMRQFRATIRDSVALLQGELVQVPINLQEPEFFTEALKQLKTLLKDFDSSLKPIDTREESFKPILVEALDPFLEGCAALAKSLKEPNLQIFSLNCLFATRDILAPFAFVDGKIAELDETIQEHTATLTQSQHAWFLHTSGLHALLSALVSIADIEDENSKIPTLEPFKEEALISASETLDDFLPSALIDAMEVVKSLRNQQAARKITQDAAERFCEDFEFVEAKIQAADEAEDDKEGSDEGADKLRNLYPRTGAEIRVLLS
ncbi:MAG: Golgi transport complex subunit 6 [Vezdaea aestivalis]|nr:MAG: Golgi transport complex subunit 6 [Vezdaea aestivalis]